MARRPATPPLDHLFVRHKRPPSINLDYWLSATSILDDSYTYPIYHPAATNRTIIEWPLLLTMAKLSTADVGNKYETDVKWPTKVKLNHPRPLNTTREARTGQTATNGPQRSLPDRTKLRATYAGHLSLLRLYFGKSQQAGRGGQPMTIIPLLPRSDLVQVFSPATLTAAPMRGARRDKIVNYNPIPWLLRLDRWKGLMWDCWCYIVNISNEMIALSHRHCIWLTSIFIICGQFKVIWYYLLHKHLNVSWLTKVNSSRCTILSWLMINMCGMQHRWLVMVLK